MLYDSALLQPDEKNVGQMIRLWGWWKTFGKFIYRTQQRF